jgi:hypothetical protein
MNQIQLLASAISSYIDMYDEEKLSPEEATILINTRTIILESLEMPASKKLSKKKQRKIIKRLDDSFSKVIKVFSDAQKPNAEIMETIKNKREKKKDTPPVIKELDNEKKKVSFENKKDTRFQSDRLMDAFAKRIDEMHNEQDMLNAGMHVVLKTIAKITKEIEDIKASLEKNKK